MANSVKLLNFVDPDGVYVKFYTELDSGLVPGDRVFIVGGNYDNSNIAAINPYDIYAAGYTVIASDLTNTSNSVTLNIKYNDPRFSANPTSTLFEPYTVYTSQLNQYINVNTPQEAYISKNRFAKGEFNGGSFVDGVFGQYQRYEKSEADKYTAALNASNIDQTSLTSVEQFFHNYNIPERPVPSEEFESYFNRKDENQPAVFSNGIFLGGNWQWGQWITKFPNTKTGKQQMLNAQGGIKNPLDQSQYIVQTFNNNFNNLGYNIVVSGNFGRVWYGDLMLFFDDVNNQIVFNFIPYELRRALSSSLLVQLDVKVNDASAAYRNSKIFTISFNPVIGSNSFTLLDNGIVQVYEKIYSDPSAGTGAFRPASVQILIADPGQVLLSDPGLRSVSSITPFLQKHNSFYSGRLQDADWFDGIWLSGQFQGGEWYWGELKSGRIGSILRRTTWHNGYFNGTTNSAFANDLFWLNGIWNNGTWEGARNFKVTSLIQMPLVNGVRTTNLQMSLQWSEMFKIGETVLLSYFKNSNSSSYLTNWTNTYTQHLIEAQNFTILNVVRDFVNQRLLVTIDLNLDTITGINYTSNILSETIADINYQFSRISTSRFDSGIWNNGTWQSGYFNGNLKPITIQSFTQKTLTIGVDSVSGLITGQTIELSNVRITYIFNYITLLGGTLGTNAGGVQVDDRDNVQYWLNLEQSLHILDLDLENNLIILDISDVMSHLQESATIINIDAYYPNTSDKRAGILAYTTQSWRNGTFNTGVWENGLWKNGIFTNIFVEDPTNTQNKSIWRSGVWLNGNWNNGVFLSGIWEAGVWINGIMTNGWKRSSLFWNGFGSWMFGDSIWYDGEWMNGQWLRGVWKHGTFDNGTIENAGIDSIEIVNGKYLNGKQDVNGNPIFSSALNTSNALNSAPNLIFIDANGLVQFDQSSWYQNDYNVIIKDLYLRDNPFNDQMFNVIDRNTTASQISISVQGGDGTTGADIPQSIINASLPIVVIKNIVDTVETDPGIFWYADQSYKRIIAVNTNNTPYTFSVVGRIINDLNEKPNLVFNTILKMTSDSALDNNNATLTRWVYVLESARLLRINKDTLELQVLLNFSTLQNDLNVNLQQWIDILVYPAQAGIPETVFIISVIKVSVNNAFQNKYAIISYNVDLNQYTILSYSGFNPSAATIPQDWLAGLTAANLNMNTLNIKGFSLGDALNVFYKLPIDININSNSYSANNVQRQRLSFVSNAWTISEYQINVLTNLVVNTQPYTFKDYAVRSIASDFRYYLLSTDSQSIYYTQTTALVPLVNDANINTIDFGITQILALRNEFGVNMTPLFVAPQSTRFGAVDQNSKYNVLESVNSIPASTDLVRWYYDSPTKRLLELKESNAPTLYNSSTEFGIDQPPIFNNLIFITNTNDFNQLLYIDQTNVNVGQNKTLNAFNKLSPNQNPLNAVFGIADLTLTFVDAAATFIDAYYYNNFLYVLYTRAGSTLYDYYNVGNVLIQPFNNNPAPIIGQAPTQIAAAGEMNSFGIQIIYFANNNTIYNSNGTVIFVAATGSTIVDFAFYVLGTLKYMFVATVDNTQTYRIIRVSKKYIDFTQTPAWPGNNIAGPNTPNSGDIIYQTNTPISSVYANQGFLAYMVANLTGQVNLFDLNYQRNQLRSPNELIFADAYTYWVSDSSNRVVNFSNYGTSGNVTDLDFGQYQQPFEVGKYIRDASSLRYMTFNSNRYLIFLDKNINGTKINLRSIDLNLNINATADNVIINEMLNGANSLNTIIDVFGAYVFPETFVPTGTAGTAGYYLPPGTFGDQNYEIVDIWTDNGTSNAHLKILVHNITLSLYQIITLTFSTPGNTTYQLDTVDYGTSGYNFLAFNNGTDIYLNDDSNKLYRWTSASGVSLIQTLPAPIQNLFVGNSGTAGEHIYTVTNDSTVRKLYRIDRTGNTFSAPIADNNDPTFANIDWAEINYDLNGIILKNGFNASIIETTSINQIISGILKIAKIGNFVFAHTANQLYKLNTSIVNYVEVALPAVYGNIVKLVAISDTICFAFYDTKQIVEFDFSAMTSTILSIVPSYVDSGYTYVAQDIARQNGKLVILYRILSNGTSGQSHNDNYCDVWLYDTAIGGTSGFIKQNFEYTVDTINDPLDPVTYVAGTNFSEYVYIAGTNSHISGIAGTNVTEYVYIAGTDGTNGLIYGTASTSSLIYIITDTPFYATAGTSSLIYATASKPYSVKGLHVNGNNNLLWVYHDNSGLVWKVENGNQTINTATNAVEFEIIDDSTWSIIDSFNTFSISINNNVTSTPIVNYTTTTNDVTTLFDIVDNGYYYDLINLLSISNHILIPKQTFNWNTVSTLTLTPGAQQYQTLIYPLTPLGSYRTAFDNIPVFYSYSAYNDLATTQSNTNTLISPHVSGRVLYNTIWRNGQFNVGNDTTNSAYTAHLVSSRWMKGNFAGSWSTPRYLDNYAIRQESLFFGGVFGAQVFGDVNSSLTAIWHNGLFLGGTWQTGVFNNGHFLSENQILVQNISFPILVINQIVDARWDYARQMFKVQLNHFKWDVVAQNYVPTISQLTKYNLIQIPGLFAKMRMTILEIRKNKYPISGQAEIVLVCQVPNFAYPNNWLVGNYVYISGLTQYDEYLYGEHYVTDTFTYQNELWITVQSDFDKFDSTGRLVVNAPVNKQPYVGMDLLRIIDIIFNVDMTTSIIWFNLPVVYDTIDNQVQFIKDNILIESLDIIDVAYEAPFGTSGTAIFHPLDFGAVVIDETMQAFGRSVNGGNNTITLNNVSQLNTILLNGVNTVNYIGTANTLTYLTDLTVYNSNINAAAPAFAQILHALFMSGTTNIPIKDSGWMNRDAKGFSFASSTFNGTSFSGDWINISDFAYDTDHSFIWLTLNKPLKDLNTNQYIYLRGFSGNKSNIIGAAESRAFRVQQIQQDRVKIQNPFKLYNATNIGPDQPYRTKFDLNELLLYQQSMNLKADLVFNFKYAYASTNTWNGGTFVGDTINTSTFTGVWNAGTFNAANTNSVFAGEWFATPINYYWAGTIFINVAQSSNQFKLTLNLASVGINWEDGDLVRVEFLNGSPGGFYDHIVNGTVSNTYSIFFNSGNYIVNIVRLRKIDQLAGIDQLIVDRNLEIGPETDAQYHQIFDPHIYNWQNPNTALFFDGSTTFNISYVIQAIESINNDLIFDFWFNPTTVTSGFEGEPLLTFKMNTGDFTIFVAQVSGTYYLNVQYSLNSSSYIRITKAVTLDWHHVYVSYITTDGSIDVVVDTTDIVTVSNAGIISSQTGSNWNLVNLLGVGFGFAVSRDKIRDVILGTVKHTDTMNRISLAGAIDQLRFWNVDLTLQQIALISNSKFMARRFPQIAAQVTFDDPGNEFNSEFVDQKLRISNIEYVSNISLRPAASTDFLLYLNFDIEQLETYTPVVKFSTNQIQNLLTEKTYQIIAVNNGSSIDLFVEHVETLDVIEYTYPSSINSPAITNVSQQFYYSVSSLDNQLFSYQSESNNGISGSNCSHGILFASTNTASWNTLPRIFVRFNRTGLVSSVDVLVSLDSSPMTVVYTQTLTNVSINAVYSKYAVLTHVDQFNNLTIDVILGNQYSEPILSTQLTNVITGTVYVATAYGLQLTKFKNRQAESYKFLSNFAYGQNQEVYITNTHWIFNPTTPFVDDASFNQTIQFNLNNPTLFHFGDETVSNINSVSLIKYNMINIYSQTDRTGINLLISGDNTNLQLLNYINQTNYQSYSNYFIIYPKISNYGVIEQIGGTAGTSGFGISGYGTPADVTTFNYYLGDNLNELRLSDQYGTNLEIYPGGGPIVFPDHVISETFILLDNGNPRWTIDQVTFNSNFNNGNYNSSVWRAGIFNNGQILLGNFIWKWGLANGGNISDPSI